MNLGGSTSNGKGHQAPQVMVVWGGANAYLIMKPCSEFLTFGKKGD